MDQMLEWELKRFLLEAEKFSAEAEAIHKQRSEPGDGSFADPCGKAESPIHMADRLGYSDEVVFLKRMLENAKANRFHQEELDAWYVDHVRFLCVLKSLRASISRLPKRCSQRGLLRIHSTIRAFMKLSP
jgi:hypothetical protein